MKKRRKAELKRKMISVIAVVLAVLLILSVAYPIFM